MSDIDDLLPRGFSISIPAAPSPGSKKLSAPEIEKELLSKITKQEKELRETFFVLAKLYSETNRLDQASFYLEKLMHVTSDLSEKAHYYFSMGQLMEMLDNFPMAVQYYQQALALESANQDDRYFIHNNIGFSLNKLGRYYEAEGYCRKAIQIDLTRHNAYKNLAISLDGQEKYIEAAGNFIKATKANAADSRALHHLEDLLNRQPKLLRDNPALQSELEECRKASKFGELIIKGIMEKYWS